MFAEKKTELVQKFRTHETDTGSPEVQVAILSERIAGLTEHFRPTPTTTTVVAA